MGRYKTLATNTIIFGICNFTSKLLVFFMLPFYTAVMSKEEFGTADYINTVVGLFIPVLSLSIAQGCMRYALDRNEDPKQTFTFGFKVLSGGVLILLCTIPLLEKLSIIKDYIFIFILLYTSHVFQNFFSLFARGLKKVSLVGVSGVTSAFVVVLSNILFLFVFRFGVKGFLMSIVVSDLFAIAILFIGCKLHRFFTLKTDIRLSKDILYYSLPMIPNSLGWWINHSVSRLFLNHYCGVADVGIYSAATKIPNMIDTFRGFFIQAWQLSTIMEYENEEAISFFEKIYKMYNVFLILLCTVLLIFSKSLASVLYSNVFFEAWKYTPVLIIGVLFGSLIAYFTPTYLAHKKTNRLFFSTLFGALITLVLNSVLIPSIGIMGAAIAMFLSNFAVYSYVFVDCRKYFPFNLLNFHFISSYIILIIYAYLIICLNISPLGVYSLFFLIIIFLINKHDIQVLSKESVLIIKNKYCKKEHFQ